MGNLINQDQLASAVRWILTTGGTYLVTKGVVSGDIVTWLVGGVGPVVAFAWSMFTHSQPK